MPTIALHGILEIDTVRGVMWFHTDAPESPEVTVLRICQLPKPVPNPEMFGMLDLTWGQCVNYRAGKG